MTKEETTKLLSLLTAYYGRQNTDAETTVNAWWLLLRDYNYKIAEQAVLEYVKADKREYSQFPKVGVIIKSIEDEEKAFIVIRNYALYGREYEGLPERSKKWISKERYARLKKCPEEYLLENIEQIKATLSRNLLPERSNKNGNI